LGQNKEESFAHAFEMAKDKNLDASIKLSIARLLIGESDDYTSAALILCNEVAFPHIHKLEENSQYQEEGLRLWKIWQACGYKVLKSIFANRGLYEIKSADFREFLDKYRDGLSHICSLVGKNKPTCFISRSFTGETDENIENHDQIDLFLQLIGIKTIYDINGDRNGLPGGGSIFAFMRNGICSSDYVMMLCTRNYKNRQEARYSGVYTEFVHIHNRMKKEAKINSHELNFLLPFLIEGTYETSIPSEFLNETCVLAAVKGETFNSDVFIQEVLKSGRLFSAHPSRKGIQDEADKFLGGISQSVQPSDIDRTGEVNDQEDCKNFAVMGNRNVLGASTVMAIMQEGKEKCLRIQERHDEAQKNLLLQKRSVGHLKTVCNGLLMLEIGTVGYLLGCEKLKKQSLLYCAIPALLNRVAMLLIEQKQNAVVTLREDILEYETLVQKLIFHSVYFHTGAVSIDLLRTSIHRELEKK
jgi:hypothetical protein